MATIGLTINEEPVDVDASSEMPLLWALRDLLGLNGTKYGCGVGLCGACTVHIDGSPARSCVTPVGSVAGRAVTTIEGLAAQSHPLLESWIEANVAQCGFCQPGQIMTAAYLLSQNADPSREEIAAAMRTVLCRCGTYLRIRSAIELAVEQSR